MFSFIFSLEMSTCVVLQIRPDTWSSKYRIWADVPAEGRIDGCALSVVSGT